MKENDKIFVVRIGNRNYAHKALLDKWLLAQIKKKNVKGANLNFVPLFYEMKDAIFMGKPINISISRRNALWQR